MKRDISSENSDDFQFLLENTNWGKILPDNSPGKVYETFHIIFFLIV